MQIYKFNITFKKIKMHIVGDSNCTEPNLSLEINLTICNCFSTCYLNVEHIGTKPASTLNGVP